jgi:hypothetical protein
MISARNWNGGRWRWLIVLIAVLSSLEVVAFAQPTAAIGAPRSIAEPYRTFVLSLPRGVDSLPDIRLLRPGDSLLVSVHTARQALREIIKLKQGIRDRGANPESYKYIVRTFPDDLEPTTAGPGGPRFFAGTSAAEIGRLRARTFAIMFDHEPAWYRRSAGRLVAWQWDYEWSRDRIQALAREVNDRGFRAGTIVTGGAERSWKNEVGASQTEGFARLMKPQRTDLSYLIVQAQSLCHMDRSGATYGAFAAHLANEIDRLFGPDAVSQIQNVALQVSLDDTLSQRSNYVPPEWAERCLDAVPPGASAVRAFFLFPQGKTHAPCEVLMHYRPVAGATCG